MERYFRLFEALKKIYGSKFVSDLFGKKRTNIIKLPPKEAKDFLKKELNITEAGDRAVAQGKKNLAELVLDVKQIEKLNDQELLTLTNNAERMAQRTNPEAPVNKVPSSGRVGDVIDMNKPAPKAPADIIDIRTQETVPPEGIASLLETSGQKAPPGTLMGNLESRIKQLEASGEDLSKMKGQYLKDIMEDPSMTAPDASKYRVRKRMSDLYKQGLVKATANDIMITDMKSGKFPATKEMQQEILEGSPKSLDYFRRFYGEDALEVLDSLIPDLENMRTSREAADFAKKQYNFEPKMDRAPGSIDLDDARKAEQEFNIIPADSEEGKVITEKLIGKPKAPVTELVTAEKIILDMKNMDPMDAMKEANKVLKKEGKYKNLKEEDVERIMEDTNDFIFGRDIPEDPEGFAVGGRVGYAYGSGLKLIELLNKAKKSLKQAIKESADDIIPTGDSKLDADMAVDNLLEKLGVDRDAVDGYDILDAYDEAYKTVTRPKVLQGGIGSLSDEEGMEMMNALYPEGKIRIGGQELDLSDIANDVKLMNEKGLRGDNPGDFDKFVEMQLSGELGPQQQMKTIKMELRNKYSRYLDDETMDVIQASNNPQKVAEVYANVREAALLSDRGVPTEEIVDTIIKTPRTKQADGTGPQGLNYLLGF